MWVVFGQPPFLGIRVFNDTGGVGLVGCEGVDIMAPDVKEVVRALLTGIIYAGMIQRDPICTGIDVYVPNGSVESALASADKIINRVEANEEPK